MTTFFMDCDPCSPEQLRLANPTAYATADAPPAYWAYGGQDPLIHGWAQGVFAAFEWAEAVGEGSSFLDYVEHDDHNLDHTTLNQRAIERFLDTFVAAAR